MTSELEPPDPPPSSKSSRTPLFIIAGVILAIIIIGAIGVQMSSPGEPGDSDPGPTSVDDMDIVIGIRNYKYNPSVISIPRGASVTWLNDDKVDHTATAKNAEWDSTIIHSEQLKALTFTTPGSYNYYCTIHPYMTATLTVRVDGPPSTTPTPTITVHPAASSTAP